MCGQVDDVYEPIKAIGRGAYGVVCSARNKRTGEKVAIKKVGNIFSNLVDARRALREVRARLPTRPDKCTAFRLCHPGPCGALCHHRLPCDGCGSPSSVGHDFCIEKLADRP